jgi:hypothetical protein
MIIKLAVINRSFENTLNKQEKGNYKAMQIGAGIGGGLLGLSHAGHFYNDLKPEVGKVRRFLVQHSLANARPGEMMSKFNWTIPHAASMAAVGGMVGAVAGLGTHLLHQKAKQLKQKSR